MLGGLAAELTQANSPKATFIQTFIAYLQICNFASFPAALLLLPSPAKPSERLSRLTWRSLPKGNCGWKSKEQTLHASAKNGNHGRASGSPVHGDLVSSQKQKSCEIAFTWTQSGNWRTERSGPFMGHTVKCSPGLMSFGGYNC